MWDPVLHTLEGVMADPAMLAGNSFQFHPDTGDLLEQ